jgi:predicted lipoprotein with Yx(FWY)xxD motif/PBP1b-binding outer membrane lipoprotein LpoB
MHIVGVISMMRMSIVPMLAVLLLVIAGCSSTPSGPPSDQTNGQVTGVQTDNTSINAGSPPVASPVESSSVPTTPVSTTPSQAITSDAMISYRTYRGFIAPNVASRELNTTSDTATYTVYDSVGNVVSNVSMPVDSAAFSQLITDLNSNDFLGMNDSYGWNNPDVGSQSITVVEPGFSKTVVVGILAEGPKPPDGLQSIETDIGGIRDTVTGSNTPENTSSTSVTSANTSASNESSYLKSSAIIGGHILVDNNGMTLYTFSPDSPGVSMCYNSCAVAWPPLLVNTDSIPQVSSDVSSSGDIGIISRTDGTHQVTYNSMPLYYFKNDMNPGDTNGDGLNGFGGFWHIVHI